MGLLKKLVKKTPFTWDDRLYERATRKTRTYFAPTQKVRVRDFVREVPHATRTVLRGIATGTAGRDASRAAERIGYLRPVAGNVRVRDVVRELPTGIHETLKGVPQWGTRAAISIYEAPKALRTGRATGKWYNTPFGRVNSFQSESQNRVRRGESAAKAIAHGILDVALGAGDFGAAAKSLLAAAKRAPVKEVRNIARDFTQPLTQHKRVTVRRTRRTETVPGIYAPGGVPQRRTLHKPVIERTTKAVTWPTPFRSAFMRSLSRPGLTIKSVNGPTNKNTQRINAWKQKSQKDALKKVAAMPRGVVGVKKQQRLADQILPEVAMKKGYKNAYKVYSGDKKQAKVAQLLPEVAKKTRLPQDIIVRDAFFKKMVERHPELNRNQLFEFVKTLHFPDNIQQLSATEKLNFFRKLEDSVKTNVVGTVKNSSVDNAVTTSFLTKSKTYPENIKKTSKEVFSKDVTGGALRSSSPSSQVTNPPAGARPSSGLSGVSDSTGSIPLLPAPRKSTLKEPPLNRLMGKEVIIIPPPTRQMKPAKTTPEAFARQLDEEIKVGKEAAPQQYNDFQKRAYELKKARSQRTNLSLNWGTKLMRSGWRKKELQYISPKQGKLMAQLAELGYPKKQIRKYMGDYDMMKRIVNNNVSYSTLDNYYKRKRAVDTKLLEGIDTSKLKDINPLMKGWRDVYRNFETAFGEQYPIIKERLLDPFDAAKGDFIAAQKEILDEVYNKIVKGLGITKGSKLSALVQKYGEKLIDLDELKKQAPKYWQKVVKADKFFRAKYDQMIDELNRIREYYYPTHPLYPESSAQIPKRKDYYRHFQEMQNDFNGLLKMFETPSAIDPRLEGISEHTKPLKRWLSFAQKRKGGETTYDAVGGFLDYTRAHSYAKHIDPFIKQFRGLDEEARKAQHAFAPQYRGLREELVSNAYITENLAKAKTDDVVARILTDKLKIKEPSKTLRDALLQAETEDEVADVMERTLRDKNGKPLPSLERFRDYKAVEDGQLNNFINFLDEFAGDLAGKTSKADRWVQDRVGRTAFRAVRWMNSRIKANTVVGNLGSSLAQWFNLPNGVANAGPLNTLLGMRDAMISLWTKNAPIHKSAFITERYFDDYGKFDRTLLDRTKIKPFALWITGIGDEIATKTIWWAHYKKALRKGIADPVKYADDWTRKMVAGRGVGEVPIDQKSTLVQLIAPFQLEVANQWYVFRDWARARKMTDQQAERMFGKLITWALMSYAMNRTAAHIRGSDVSFDPVNAVLEGYDSYKKERDKGVGALKFGGRVAGEVVSNLPFGQSLAMIYPERGWKLGPKDPETGERKRLPREQFFGAGDPTRFGSGLLLHKGLAQPQYSLLTPFGGAQIKRTLEARKADKLGAVTNSSGRVMYPTPKDALGKTQMYLFGKYSTSQARAYFNTKQTPLSPKESALYKLLPELQRKDFFESVQQRREVNRQKRAAKDALLTSHASVAAKDDSVSILDKLLGRSKKQQDPVIGIARAYGVDVYMDSEPPHGINGEIWKANRKKTARAVLTSTDYASIPENVREEMVQRMGFDREDMDYMRLGALKSSAGNSVIAPVIAEKITTAKDYAHVVNRLLDEKILTNPLIKEMYVQGVIDDKLYYLLKNAKKYGGAQGSDRRKKYAKVTGSRRKKGRKRTKAEIGTMSVLEKYFASAITRPVRTGAHARAGRITMPSTRLSDEILRAATRSKRSVPRLHRESIRTTLRA